MKHIQYRCSKECLNGRCAFCDGGLFFCVTCKAGEGTLPTDCPGEVVGGKREIEIYAGRLDYTERLGWVRKDGPDPDSHASKDLTGCDI